MSGRPGNIQGHIPFKCNFIPWRIGNSSAFLYRRPVIKDMAGLLQGSRGCRRYSLAVDNSLRGRNVSRISAVAVIGQGHLCRDIHILVSGVIKPDHVIGFTVIHLKKHACRYRSIIGPVPFRDHNGTACLRFFHARHADLRAGQCARNGHIGRLGPVKQIDIALNAIQAGIAGDHRISLNIECTVVINTAAGFRSSVSGDLSSGHDDASAVIAQAAHLRSSGIVDDTASGNNSR